MLLPDWAVFTCCHKWKTNKPCCVKVRRWWCSAADTDTGSEPVAVISSGEVRDQHPAPSGHCVFLHQQLSSSHVGWVSESSVEASRCRTTPGLSDLWPLPRHQVRWITVKHIKHMLSQCTDRSRLVSVHTLKGAETASCRYICEIQQQSSDSVSAHEPKPVWTWTSAKITLDCSVWAAALLYRQNLAVSDWELADPEDQGPARLLDSWGMLGGFRERGQICQPTAAHPPVHKHEPV